MFLYRYRSSHPHRGLAQEYEKDQSPWLILGQDAKDLHTHGHLRRISISANQRPPACIKILGTANRKKEGIPQVCIILSAHALIRQTPALAALRVLSHFLLPRFTSAICTRLVYTGKKKSLSSALRHKNDIQAWRMPSGSPTGPNWSASISMKTRS